MRKEEGRVGVEVKVKGNRWKMRVYWNKMKVIMMLTQLAISTFIRREKLSW
jgi:hypothetical protein